MTSLETTTLLTTILGTLLGGGVLGAFITQFFARDKTRAEAKKTEAEAERTKAETTKILAELNLKTSQVVESSGGRAVKGWIKAGDDPKAYEIGVDQHERYRGKPSGYIKSVEPSRGFGTLMQTFKASSYAGTRLKMTGSARSTSVEDWAGFWMRVDGPTSSERVQSFDNMQDRPITGNTGWTKYQIVLDVPENADDIAVGVLLSGAGQVWIADLEFEVVDSNVP